ncbi:DUF6572 domain-containing protein [Nocardia fluminea]|uniref:DUF6572 domain-containing protein n=1 Tax=Nocardia fluminea TaxID=134984 RepID=UPI0036727E3B
MTVSEHDRIDQVAANRQGQVVLCMIEDRSYAQDDVAVMNEDFRHKLNAYIHAVRSGVVGEMTAKSGVRRPAGVEFRLVSPDEPSDPVKHMIDMVNRELAAENITATWEEWGDRVTPAIIEDALVNAVIDRIGTEWKTAYLWAVLVGDEGRGGIQVHHEDGTVEAMEASETLQELFFEHKRLSYDKRTGTWISAVLSIAGTDSYAADYKNDDIHDAIPTPTPKEFARELERFPRSDGASAERLNAGVPAVPKRRWFGR